MIQNFHWGHAIFIFYGVFVLALISVLIASFGVDRSLVLDDYYSLDLRYQERLEQINEAILTGDLIIERQSVEQTIVFDFGHHQELSGTIHLYRASDAHQDQHISIEESPFVLNTSNLQEGAWTIKVDWKADGIRYYKESPLYL